jgi:hypothetical protein
MSLISAGSISLDSAFNGVSALVHIPCVLRTTVCLTVLVLWYIPCVLRTTVCLTVLVLWYIPCVLPQGSPEQFPVVVRAPGLYSITIE